MNKYLKRGVSYVVSLFLVTLFIVYIFNVPSLLTSADDLIYEYYYKNMISNFIFDIFLVAFYLSIIMIVIKHLKIKQYGQQIIASICVTMVISSIFMTLFNNGFQEGSFFSRWFKKAGFNAVIYDGILVSLTFILMNFIHKYI